MYLCICSCSVYSSSQLLLFNANKPAKPTFIKERNIHSFSQYYIILIPCLLSRFLQVSGDPSLLLNSPVLGASVSDQSAAEGPRPAVHQVQLLRKQLQQQEQQALAAAAQVLRAVDSVLSLKLSIFFLHTNQIYPILSAWI